MKGLALRVGVVLAMLALAGVIGVRSAPSVAAADASSDSQQEQIYTLQLELQAARLKSTKLAHHSAALTKQLTGANARIAAYKAQNARYRAAYARLHSANVELTQENNGLKGTLAQQVAAVARAGDLTQLLNVVLLPAHNFWACPGSVLERDTFVSVGFYKKGADGTCLGTSVPG